MHSVRLRIMLTAALATALAVSVIAVFLVSRVDGALRDEIDDSIALQALDYADNIFTSDDIAFARRPSDIETLFVVVNLDGEIFDSNDDGVDGAEVVSALALESRESSEVHLVDLSLTSPTDTPGSEEMRAAYVDLVNFEEDETRYVVFARVTAGVERTVNGLRNALLISIPLLVLFVAALSWWLAGRSLRPVDRMRREVDEFRLTDTSQRVSEPPSTDEIGQLATTMNAMLARLEDFQRSQDQFVSDAAHELRTPLASIAAQLDVDAAHPDTADPDATAANVRAEVVRLQGLIDGLLASARGQTLSSADVRLLDLDVLVGESVRRVPRPAEITLDQRSVSAGEVRGNPTALASALDNVLANAYRHATALVAVSVGTDEHGVWMAVDDDGTGIATQDRDRVFDRFVRLDEARTKDSGGSGLGLTLARETARSHGGDLTIAGSPLGGARFLLRLPPT